LGSGLTGEAHNGLDPIIVQSSKEGERVMSEMCRRTFVATAGAAAIAGALPVMAQAADAPDVVSYALMMTYPDHSIYDANVEVLIIHPRGKFDIAPEWTIERAMTEIWPQSGKWWNGDPGEFFAVSWCEDTSADFFGRHINVELNASSPTTRDETLVAVITKDGSVEFGPQFDGDESDRAAWREMGRVFVVLAEQ
jgi:hypothetical protein